MSDFCSYMGMAKVVLGPDGKPVQLTGSGFEIGEIAKQLGIASLSAVMLVPITGTGAIRESICPAIAGAPAVVRNLAQKLPVSERLAFCRSHLSLNMTQLAAALRRERQTLYGWLSGTSTPHEGNERRLETLFRLASDWHKYANFPVGKAATHTIQQLYGVFFRFAQHIKDRADLDEQHGIDRSFYRWHLQRESGLTPEEYAVVLESAQRFVLVDDDVNKRLEELNQAAAKQRVNSPTVSPLQSGGYEATLASLTSERDSVLNAEMYRVRAVIGQQRADSLDAYLQNSFLKLRLFSRICALIPVPGVGLTCDKALFPWP